MAIRAHRNTNSAVRSMLRFIVLFLYLMVGARGPRLIRLSLLDDGADHASVVIHKDYSALAFCFD